MTEPNKPRRLTYWQAFRQVRRERIERERLHENSVQTLARWLRNVIFSFIAVGILIYVLSLAEHLWLWVRHAINP